MKKKLVIFDANALLNACYVEESWAQQAFQLLKQAEANLATPPQAILEFDQILSKIYDRWREAPTISLLREKFLGNFPLILSPKSQLDIPRRLESDKYLIDAALAHDATIVSSDIPLVSHLRMIRQEGKTPLECIYALDPTRPAIWSGVRPSPDMGGIYFQCTIHRDPQEQLTIILDCPPFGRVAIGRAGDRLALQLLNMGDELFPGCSFGLNAPEVSGSEIKMRFMFGWTREKIIFLSNFGMLGATTQRSGTLAPKIMHLGSQNGMTCSIFARAAIFTDREPPRLAVWRKWLEIGAYATPQPFDADRLRSAVLQRVHQR